MNISGESQLLEFNPIGGRKAFERAIALLPDGNRWFKVGNTIFYRAIIKDGKIIEFAKTSKKGSGRKFTPILEDAYTYLRRESEKVGSGGVFFIPTNPSETPKKDDIATANLISVEFDGGTTEEQLEKLNWLSQWGFPPTMILSSGGKSLHAHWSIETLDIETRTQLQRALTILMGSDPAVCTVTQPMRFPGFIRSNVVDGVETRRAEQPLLYCNPNNTYTLEQTKTIIKSLYDSRGLTYPELISDECFRYLKGKWDNLTKDDTQLETVLTDATIYTYFRKPRKPKATQIVDETVNESYNEPETNPEPLDIKDPIVLKALSKAIAHIQSCRREDNTYQQIWLPIATALKQIYGEAEADQILSKVSGKVTNWTSILKTAQHNFFDDPVLSLLRIAAKQLGFKLPWMSRGSLDITLINYLPGHNNKDTLYLIQGLGLAPQLNKELGINVAGIEEINAETREQLTRLLNALKPERLVITLPGGTSPTVVKDWLRLSDWINYVLGYEVEFLWYEGIELNKDNFADAKYINTTEFSNNLELTEVEVNNPNQTLHIIEDWKTFDEYCWEKQPALYCPNFWITAIAKQLFDDKVLTYKAIEFVAKEGSSYKPWLKDKDCSKFRYINSFISKILGLKPIGSMDNKDDEQAFLGQVETDNPFFTDRTKLIEEHGKIWRDKQENEPVNLMLKTAKGTLPLAAVAYNGVIPWLVNPDRETTGKYLPKIDLVADTDTYCFGRVVGVQSDKGTGKNVNAVALIKQLKDIYGIDVRVTAIAPTVNLNRQLAGKIPDCISLNDFKGIGLSESEFNHIINAPCISLCLNSLHQFDKRVYSEPHALLLDEVESLLQGFLNPVGHYDTKTKSANRKQLARAIRETVENDGIVLVLDADLKDITLVKLAEFAGVSQDKIVRIVHKKDEPEFIFSCSPSRKHIIGKLTAELARGKKIALATDSKKLLKQLEIALPGIRAIYYHQDTIAHPNLTGFADDPNKFLEEHHPQLFAFSPSAATGFDITYNEFDFVFGIFHGVLSPDVCRQMLMRIRDVSIPRVIFAPETAQGQAPIAYKPSEILADELEAINGALSAVGLDNIEFSRSALTDLRALQLAKQASQFYGYKDAIVGGLLINQNCRLVPYLYLDTEQNGLKEAREELENMESDSIAKVKALDLASPEFKKLDSKAYKTLDERSQWIKSRTQDRLPGLDINKDFALNYLVSGNGRNKLRAVSNLGDSLYFDESKAIARNWMFNRQQDIKTGKADDLLMLDMTSRTRKNKTLANLGMVAVIQHFCIKQIENITDCLPNIVTISLEDEPIKRFLDRFIKNQGYYSKVLGIKIKPAMSRAKKLKTLLKLVGIKLATPKDLIGTQRVRIELPYDLMGILIAHYNGLQDRLDKLEHDGNSPRNKLGDKYDTSPLKALLDKVSKLENGDKELLIKELILFLKSCSTKGRAENNTTTETKNRDTGKSPPVEVG